MALRKAPREGTSRQTRLVDSEISRDREKHELGVALGNQRWLLVGNHVVDVEFDPAARAFRAVDNILLAVARGNPRWRTLDMGVALAVPRETNAFARCGCSSLFCLCLRYL